MKKQTLTIFGMSALLLVMTAISVNAQQQRSKMSTKIDFAFNVGDKTLPAGEYTVRPNTGDSQSVWLIQNKEQGVNIYFFTASVSSSRSPKQAKLVFNQYGNEYFLSQIWRRGNNSGRELEMRQRERELAKGAGERKTIVVVVGLPGED